MGMGWRGTWRRRFFCTFVLSKAIFHLSECSSSREGRKIILGRESSGSQNWAWCLVAMEFHEGGEKLATVGRQLPKHFGLQAVLMTHLRRAGQSQRQSRWQSRALSACTAFVGFLLGFCFLCFRLNFRAKLFHTQKCFALALSPSTKRIEIANENRDGEIFLFLHFRLERNFRLPWTRASFNSARKCHGDSTN